MTVIAWNGQWLAADRLEQSNKMAWKGGGKIRRIASGELLCSCGNAAQGILLEQWYEQGANPDTWPGFQKPEDFTTLIIAQSTGVVVYEDVPALLPVVSRFMAWGAGRDFAMGAMAQGATAKEAVLIANQFSIYCGFGVDAYEICR